MAIKRLANQGTSGQTGRVAVYSYRYLDPLTGRWTRPDPIEENGGLNIFGFVSNDGINWADVYGLMAPIERADKSFIVKSETVFGFDTGVQKGGHCCASVETTRTSTARLVYTIIGPNGGNAGTVAGPLANLSSIIGLFTTGRLASTTGWAGTLASVALGAVPKDTTISATIVPHEDLSLVEMGEWDPFPPYGMGDLCAEQDILQGRIVTTVGYMVKVGSAMEKSGSQIFVPLIHTAGSGPLHEDYVTENWKDRTGIPWDDLTLLATTPVYIVEANWIQHRWLGISDIPDQTSPGPDKDYLPTEP